MLSQLRNRLRSRECITTTQWSGQFLQNITNLAPLVRDIPQKCRSSRARSLLKKVSGGCKNRIPLSQTHSSGVGGALSRNEVLTKTGVHDETLYQQSIGDPCRGVGPGTAEAPGRRPWNRRPSWCRARAWSGGSVWNLPVGTKLAQTTLFHSRPPLSSRFSVR